MKFGKVNDIGMCETCVSRSWSIQDAPVGPEPLDTSSEKKNSENDDKTRLEKFTILHYHRDEHARKLLESIRRDCTQEENDPVNRTLDATSDTPTRSEKAVTVGSDSVSHESMQRLSPNC